ncbi:MAG TPA: hypothetical protein VJ483_07990 [Holophagaceae bacterium]|nr:hypothetical protein [Holophagaceae bacterium]
MTPSQSRQRGEGKLGCVISLLIIGAVGAAAYKAFPVYYSDRELLDEVKDIGPKASGVTNPEAVEAMIRAKAKELEIQEVLGDATAVRVTLVPSAQDLPGKCTIKLRYKRPVDFYGLYQYTFVTDETVTCDIYTNIR